MSASQALAPKVPPHSQEAERAVLGAVLIDNRAWDNISDKLTVDDFYRHEHRLVFSAISHLAERSKSFDVLTMADFLRQKGELEQAGGESYLFELAQSTPSSANAEAYAVIVRERSILRQLISSASDIASSAFNADGRDSKELLDQAEQLVFSIAEQGNRGSGPVQVADLLSATTARIDELYHADAAITGVSTGFSDMDEMTSGLQKGDLIIVAARPSMGKTTFSMNIAEYAAIKGDKPVLVFSMEMPAEQLVMRMISSLGRIDQHNLRTGNLTDEDWPRISSAVSMLAEAQLFIDDTPALTPIEMRARARRVARAHNGIGLIVIDYLQLMRTAGRSENRTNEISEISRSLKALAKELEVPVIALSQLNRGLESRTDKRPVMSDLRESGAIEQDADIIAFIYRDEVYHEDSPDKGAAEIIIRKQRNGPIGDFKLTFLGQFTRFENFVPAAVETGVFV
jgi:replicative DNA helicase